MISLKNIMKTYDRVNGDKRYVLESVSMTIPSDAILLIQGESGVGKSTLLKIVGLLDFKYDGCYELDGVDTKQMNEKHRSKIRNGMFGFVFQNFMLIESESVYENVRIPLYYSNKMRHRDHRRVVLSMLDSLGICSLIDAPVSTLSGGERQRVAIARALINNPSYVFLDEPTSAIDSKTATEIMKFIYAYQKIHRCALIIVSHDESMYLPKNTIHYILEDKNIKVQESETASISQQ